MFMILRKISFWASLIGIAAVILLVAIVAAIALTLRSRKTSKYIDPARQVEVRRQDRVRMIKMPSEKRDG